MKKIFFSILFIFFLFNISNTFSYNAIQVSKTEIDKIKCDLNYTGELRQGFSYEFSDFFSNSKNSDLKIEEVKVHMYEEYDYNNSNDVLNFEFTDWIKNKNNILQTGDSGKVVESTNKYQIINVDTLENQENFKITYTAKYYRKSSNGDFTMGPYYHTECKNYKVIGVSNKNKDKKNNTERKTEIVNNTKSEIETENLTEYERYIKKTIFKYKANKIKLNKILKEENEKGIGLIKLPKILPKTGTPIEQRTKKLKNPKLDLELINSRFRLAGSNNPDLKYWLQVLPKQDQNAKKYIVIPSSGLVMPINDIPKSDIDYTSLLSGREIKVNKYLKTGAMEYAGTSINGFGKVGNKVIFAHSSYFKSDNGRYKTDFQKIIELDPGEEIWIYEKINGKYKRFKYKTVKSYNTLPSNVSVLKPGIGKNLTLFTCTPIGGIAGRWIVEAKYIDEEKAKLKNKLEFNNVSPKLKSKIDILVYKISKLEEKKKKEKILKIFKILALKEDSIKNQKTLDLLEYLKHKLVLEYYK